MHEAYVFLYIGSGRSLQSSTALLEIIDDGKAGDKAQYSHFRMVPTGHHHNRYLRSSMAPLSRSYSDPDPSAFYFQSAFGNTGNHFDTVSILWSDNIIKMDSNLICPHIIYICMVRKFGIDALHVRYAPFILGLNVGKG